MSTPGVAPSTRHFGALDGIRGLAVLMVLLFHYSGGAHSGNRFVRTVGELNRGGWSGVVLFFVLSGFLITGILWDSFDDPHWWRKFFARRSLRIFPLYFLALVLLVLAAIPWGDIHGVLHHVWVYFFFLENIPGLGTTNFTLPSPLGSYHLWSIAVEEQFYLIWPFLLIVQKTRSRAKLLCLATFLLSFFFRIYIWTRYGGFVQLEFLPFLLTQAGALAAGAWLGLAFRGPEWQRIIRVAPIAAAIAAAGFVICGLASGTFAATGTYMTTLGLPFCTLLYAALIALVLVRGVVSRIFSIGWLRFLGNISYGVYIYSVLFGIVIDTIARELAGSRSQVVFLSVRLVTACVVSVVSAVISFHLYEKQFLRFKRYFVPDRKVSAVSAVSEPA